MVVTVRRTFCLSLLTILLVSCAKISYIVEQGQGQFSLLYRARDNQEVLNDPVVSAEIKERIRQIESYKRFFYRFMGRDATDIYSKTTILDGEAVTHLVVASPHYEIRPHRECFPFQGCFPYLGFFAHRDAREYANFLEHELKMVTYIRPVYAYSTTGHFTDPILSSFFHYQQENLAELIFHELFHTIFFIKDEVEFNENLATYVGEQMVASYFKNGEQLKAWHQRLERSRIISQKIVQLVQRLNHKYQEQKLGLADHKQAKQILGHFLTHEFLPEMEQECGRLGIERSRCKPLQKEWNNAAFAAVMTYQSSGDRIARLHQKLGVSLVGFVNFIEQEYHRYQDKPTRKGFANHLFGQHL